MNEIEQRRPKFYVQDTFDSRFYLSKPLFAVVVAYDDCVGDEAKHRLVEWANNRKEAEDKVEAGNKSNAVVDYHSLPLISDALAERIRAKRK